MSRISAIYHGFSNFTADENNVFCYLEKGNTVCSNGVCILDHVDSSTLFFPQNHMPQCISPQQHWFSVIRRLVLVKPLVSMEMGIMGMCISDFSSSSGPVPMNPTSKNGKPVTVGYKQE